MAIQIPNPGTGNGATGDNEFVLWTKTKDNFSNTTHAASRLVGTAAGNVMEVGAFGLGNRGFTDTNYTQVGATTLINSMLATGSHFYRLGNAVNPVSLTFSAGIFSKASDTFMGMSAGYATNEIRVFSGIETALASVKIMNLWHDKNATKDPNGFLKGASPIAEIYSDKMDLNEDAQKQGGITFEKLGTGNYLVKGSLGFAQEGWYIETPKDANGNVLVAVVYEQLANNDLSIKTYAKKFDDETGDIIANLLKPRDIPTGRFISLRLHELPKELPVMPTETQPEV